jgi:hypothetical protein
MIAFHPSCPVPTLAQLGKMKREGVTPQISRRADGTLVFLGATGSDGNNVDNDCNPL